MQVNRRNVTRSQGKGCILRQAQLWDSRRIVRHPSTSVPKYQDHAGGMPRDPDAPGSTVNPSGSAQTGGRGQAREDTLLA